MDTDRLTRLGDFAREPSQRERHNVHPGEQLNAVHIGSATASIVWKANEENRWRDNGVLTNEKFNARVEARGLIETHVGATVVVMQRFDLKEVPDLIGRVGDVTMNVRPTALPDDTRRLKRCSRLKVPVEFVMWNAIGRGTIENREVLIDRCRDDEDVRISGLITVACGT